MSSSEAVKPEPVPADDSDTDVEEDLDALEREAMQRRAAKAAQVTDLAKARLDLQQKLDALLEQSNAVFAAAPPAATKSKPKARGRKRMSEKEEDELLMQESTTLIGEDGEPADPNQNANGQVVTRLTVQPPNIKFGEMKKYQLEGLNWMIRLYDKNVNGILADEMGLGKTLQSISILAFLQQYRDISGPHLVVVPKSTLGNWLREFNRWCPSLNAVRFHGDEATRQEIIRDRLKPMDFDVCITSYEVAIREKNFLRRIDWHFIVVDEAHRLKNEDSVLSQTLRLLPSQHRLLLTGTPLQNNLHELWALLNFLLPTLFDSAAEFDELFTVNAATGAASEIESDVLAKLHKILRPFLLRRLKTDVATDLPPKKETLLYVGMSEMQRTVYKQVLSKDFDALNGACKERGRLLNIVMQLRKCANHPYLFEGVEDRSLPAYGDHLVFNSGKLALLDKLLPRLAAQGSRVLLFSQMTRQLDILEDYCIYRNYKHCRIDGSTEGEARDQAVDAFNAPDSDVFMFLLSTRAGGLGLNLATADTVIIYDSDWNPQMDLQAQDRAHRIGQKRPVNVFRLIVENSIEEKIIERANMKLQLDALVIQQGRLAQGSMQLSKNEMMEMIRFGADQVFRATATTGVTDDDIEAILARGAARTAEMTEKIASMLGSSSKSNFANFSVSADDSEIAEKEAIERAEREEQERKEKLARDVEFMASLTDAMGKRERKMNTYDEKQYYRELFASSSNKRFALYRPRKLPPLYDYQFVDRDRVTYLSDLEMSFYLRHSGQNARPPPEGQIRGITEEEAKERDDLLEAGFVNWNRSDYLAYCRAVARYGRENSDSSGLLTAVPGKQADEVKRYHEAFWTNIDSLSDKERILRSVAKGDSVRQKNQEFAKLIEQELKQYTNPIQQMQITYTAMNKGKGGFTHAEDVFLLVETHQLGYGEWQRLRSSIRRSELFRFDYFFKSRNELELNRRVDVLVRQLSKKKDEKKDEKKEEESKEDGQDKGKKAPAKRKLPVEKSSAPSAKAAKTK